LLETADPTSKLKGANRQQQFNPEISWTRVAMHLLSPQSHNFALPSLKTHLVP